MFSSCESKILMYGTLQYGPELLFVISNLELTDRKITLTGSTRNHYGFLPKNSSVTWTWRGTDNTVILAKNSANMFAGLTIGAGDTLTITQPIEMS